MKSIISLPFIFIIYLYFYLTPLFEMLGIFNWAFDNYISFSMNCIKIIGLYDKIEFSGNINMHVTRNLIIANHTSVLDNVVLMKLLFTNQYTWNEIVSISRVSNKKYKNTIMCAHNNLLIDRDLEHDMSNKIKLFDSWKNYNKLAIILFPEGTTNTGKLKTMSEPEKQLSKHIFNKSNEKYENLLFPKSGLFNLILKEFDRDIKTLMDLTIIYTKNGKRLLGEKNIFKSIMDDDFRIVVHIDKYKL